MATALPPPAPVHVVLEDTISTDCPWPWLRPAGRTQNRWFDATKRSLASWISWGQPMKRSRAPHISAGDANPSSATHSPFPSRAT